jgi:hypothetical protein
LNLKSDFGPGNPGLELPVELYKSGNSKPGLPKCVDIPVALLYPSGASGHFSAPDAFSNARQIFLGKRSLKKKCFVHKMSAFQTCFACYDVFTQKFCLRVSRVGCRK